MKRLFEPIIKKKEELLDKIYDLVFEIEENWTDKTEKSLLFTTSVAAETLFVLGIYWSKIGTLLFVASIINMIYFFKNRKSYSLFKSTKGKKLYKEIAEQHSMKSREEDIKRDYILENSDEKYQSFGFPLPKQALQNQKYVLYGNESPHLQFTKDGRADLHVWEYNQFSKILFVSWNPLILGLILFISNNLIRDWVQRLVIILFGVLQQAFLYYLLQQFEDREKDKKLIFNETLFEQNAYQIRLEKSRREALQKFAVEQYHHPSKTSALDSVDLQINSPPASNRASLVNPTHSPLNDSTDSDTSVMSSRTSISVKQETNLLQRKTSSTSMYSSGLATSSSVPSSARSSISYSTGPSSNNKAIAYSTDDRHSSGGASAAVNNPFQQARNKKK